MTIRRVLIVQPYGIGDLLFLTPVLRALRLLPSVEKVDLLLGSRTEAVLKANPHVDQCYSIDKDLFHRRGFFENFQELARLGRVFRKEKYDLLLDYSMRGEYAFFSVFFLGIPLRAGFDYKRRGFFQTRRMPLPQGFSGRHVVDYYCDLAEMAGIRVEDRFLEFYLTPEERTEAERLLQGLSPAFGPRFLTLSPGGGESWGKDAHFKRWPAAYFAEFSDRLAVQARAAVVLILGSPQEKKLGEEIQSRMKTKAVNLAGDVSLRIAAALIEKSSLLIGNDGGLVHLTHALRKPVIAFYGPVDPAVYGPFPPSNQAFNIFDEDLECRPCYRNFRYNADCPDRRCLSELRPDQVFGILTQKDFYAVISNEVRNPVLKKQDFSSGLRPSSK